MGYASWSETNDEHSFEVDEAYFDETGFHYSLSVVHPPECYPTRILTLQSTYSDPSPKCWIGHEVNNVGFEDINRRFEYPDDDGFDWLVIACAITGKRIPFKYVAGGGYDYWGEYDEDFEIELI